MTLQISTLLAWCSIRGIKVDPRLQIRHTEDSGIGVFSKVDIDSPTTLVQIPKTAILSVRSCSLSEFITAAPYGHDARLALSLALFGELLKGGESKWHGYLQSLPQETVNIALLWPTRQTDDCREALSWIRGTELEKELSTESQEEIGDYYLRVGEPILTKHGFAPTMEGFYHAYSLVSSRSFHVDAYHNLAMVPIADAFNHSLENQVHLESDFNVCQECGAFGECVHDDMGGTGSLVEVDTLDIVSEKGIIAETEVFNTYGEGLTNAELVARYGFALDGNDNERICWSVKELEDFGGIEAVRIWRWVVQKWATHSEWEKSGMVYNNGGRVEINGDARMSHELWVFCAICALKERELETAGIEGEEFVRLLRQTADLQVAREIKLGTMDTNEIIVLETKNVLKTVRTVVTLARFRKERIGKEGSENLDLGEYSDRLDKGLTKLAVMQVLSEDSILQSFISIWEEIEGGD